MKSFSSHKAHRAALISASLAFSQTPVYTARQRTQSQYIARCARLRHSNLWHSLCIYPSRRDGQAELPWLD